MVAAVVALLVLAGPFEGVIFRSEHSVEFRGGGLR